MLEKKTILNSQKPGQVRPKVPKRRTRAPHPPPKLSPRLSQIHFLSNFVAFCLMVTWGETLENCAEKCGIERNIANVCETNINKENDEILEYLELKSS